MFKEAHIHALTSAELQPRHFAEIDLSARQLHLWLKRSGLEDEKNSNGKWRTFSAFDVLQIATIRTLKAETDFALSKHSDLVSFIVNAEKFAIPVFSEWAFGRKPVLVTDFRSRNEVKGIDENELLIGLHPGAKIITAMALEPQIQIVINSIKHGGSNKQRSAIDQMLGSRASLVSKSKSEDEGLTITSRKMPTAKAKGKRKIQL